MQSFSFLGALSPFRHKGYLKPYMLISFSMFGFESIATWLILPVVIRSSQRLSHACVSINKFSTVKLRTAHYISYSLLDSTLLLGYP